MQIPAIKKNSQSCSRRSEKENEFIFKEDNKKKIVVLDIPLLLEIKFQKKIF